MNLYFYKYNNYYNRIVKSEATLAAYGTPVATTTGLEVNKFNFNDNLNASVILENIVSGDYMIVSNDGIDIVSRWFVLEAKRVNGNKTRVSLRRDLIVDYYDNIISAPAFIQKATLNDNNPLILNSEGMSFNQIKKSETLLQDETKTAWVVGYIPRDSFSDNQTLEIDNVPSKFDYTYDSFFSKYGTTEKELTYVNKDESTYYLITYVASLMQKRRSNKLLFASPNPGGEVCGNLPMTTKVENATHISNIPNLWIYPTLADSYCFTSLESLLNDKDKIVYNSSTRKYYKISIVYVEDSTLKSYMESGTSVSNLLNEWNSTAYEGNVLIKNFDVTKTYLEYTAHKYKLVLEEIAYEKLYVRMPKKEQRAHLNKQPYDVFCMPVNTDTFPLYIHLTLGDVRITQPTTTTAFNIGACISSNLGSGNIYDIQLLPYCPIRDLINNGQNILVNIESDDDLDESVRTDTNTRASIISKTNPTLAESGYYVVDTDDVRGLIYWLEEDTVSFLINKSLTYQNKKIENETSIYRLCSPNWNGQFEFNLAKNGPVSYFEVNMTVKPFNPYIHIAPQFSGLYGTNYGDARGLICGGDFSLPMTSSSWADYQMQNKNYDNQFNREIQNMETSHKYQMISNGISSTLGAASSGIGTGLATGNPIAGIATAGASLIGGAADMALSQASFNENKSYKVDMYNYNLQNIQAIPQSITKVGALNANNKVFPVLEYYSCTDKEKEALENKIKYNGMTVMAIGTIKDYLQVDTVNYMQGYFIRLEINEESNLLNAINDEFMKGVFI